MSALHSATSYGAPAPRRSAPSRPAGVRPLHPTSKAKPRRTAQARPATSRARSQPTTTASAPPQFFTFIFGLFVAGILLSLFINTFVQQASFQKTDLQRSINTATALKQQLETEIATAESPENLMTQAKKMGMVPANNPVFLRLSDQQILGKRIPAGTAK